MLKSLHSDKFQESRLASAAIVGCGWLGQALAKSFQASGIEVRASVRSASKAEELTAPGITPVVARFTGGDDVEKGPAGWLDASVRIVLLPPGRRSPDVEMQHPAVMAQLCKALQDASEAPVLLASATSVYPNLNREVVEDDAADGAQLTASGNAVSTAERVFRAAFPENGTVVRLAGLYGPKRHPGRFLAGKKGLPNGDAPVNLVHQDDAVGIIQAIIQKQLWGRTFNACAPEHPSRKEFYVRAAQELGMDPPVFNNEPTAEFKIVSSAAIVQQAGYRFRHPNPMASGL